VKSSRLTSRIRIIHRLSLTPFRLPSRDQAKAFEAQQKQRAHVQSFIDRFRYNANRAALVQSRVKVCASALSPIISHAPRWLSHCVLFANMPFLNPIQSFMSTRSSHQALERMELLGDVVDDPKFTFTFPPCEPLQKPIVLVNALTFGYRPERILLEAIDLRVDIRSRIGVVGGYVLHCNSVKPLV
jgi:ATP-binding cassette subfamily F protein 3